MRVDANNLKNIWFLLSNSLICFLLMSEPPSDRRQSSANSSGLNLNTSALFVSSFLPWTPAWPWASHFIYVSPSPDNTKQVNSPVLPRAGNENSVWKQPEKCTAIVVDVMDLFEQRVLMGLCIIWAAPAHPEWFAGQWPENGDEPTTRRSPPGHWAAGMMVHEEGGEDG